MPHGLKGIVDHIDDQGQLHMIPSELEKNGTVSPPTEPNKEENDNNLER